MTRRRRCVRPTGPPSVRDAVGDPVFIGPVHAPELHVMTYNVRRRFGYRPAGSPDRWADRRWLIRRLLVAEQPSVLGLQEALSDQVDWIAESLGERYRWVGRGRDAAGTGEHCPIFYDSRRLRLADWRQLALSSTPGVPGSRSWGNLAPRIVVCARFADLVTGRRLVVVNTHFDHLSRRSRSASARMVRELALAELSDVPGTGLVVTGDLNTDLDALSTVHRELTVDGVLRDAWQFPSARRGPGHGTYSGYRRPRVGGRRIDVILVGPGVHVLRTGVNAVRYDGAAGSDHEPVQAVVRLV